MPAAPLHTSNSVLCARPSVVQHHAPASPVITPLLLPRRVYLLHTTISILNQLPCLPSNLSALYAAAISLAPLVSQALQHVQSLPRPETPPRLTSHRNINLLPLFSLEVCLHLSTPPSQALSHSTHYCSDFRSKPSSKLPPPLSHQNDFNNLLRALTASMTSTQSPHLPTLTSLLRTYTSNAAHWSRYAHANPKKQYTRNLVCEVPGIFNLLLLVWTPGKQSPVHDHAEAHCLMKVLQGSLVERRFRVPEEGHEGRMEETSNVRYQADKVTYMSDALGLHEIGNPSLSDYAVSLHCESFLFAFRGLNEMG